MKTKSLRFFLLSFACSVVLCLNCYADNGSVDALIKTGNDYSNLFQYNKALENFQKATIQAPDNWEGWYLAGRTLLKLKRIDDAERHLIKAHELNPSELDIQKALGAIYIQSAKNAQANGQTAQKLEFQLKACHSYPAATKIWLALFEQWWNNGEYAKIKAESDFIVKNNRKALEEADDASLQSALIIIAKVYYSEGDYEKSEYFVNTASKIRIANDELYTLKREIRNRNEEKINKTLELAQAEINNKNYDKALNILKSVSNSSLFQVQEKIESLEKEISKNRYIKQIDELMSAKKYETAIAKLEEAFQAFPESEELIKRQAEIEEKIEKIREEEALKEKRESDIRRERQRKQDLFNMYKSDSKRYEEEGNFDSAIESLEKAKELDPQNQDIRLKIASLQNESKKVKERSDRYQRHSEKLKDLFSHKNYESCVETGRSMLTEYPEYKLDISLYVVEAYLELKEYKEADKIVENLKDNSQHEDLYNYVKGVAAYENGLNEESKSFFEKIKSSPSKYRSKADKVLFKMFMQKAQYVIYAIIIVIILVVFPRAKDAYKLSRMKRYSKRLEEIKESGTYEANFKFIKDRYEKDDVSNRKLAMLLYAAALQRTGDNLKAYDIINDYLKRDSRSPLAKNIAGETALALGETSAAALEHIQGLLKLNENRSDVISYLTKTYMSQKADHKMAQELIAKYTVINPSDSEAIIYLANVYINRQINTVQSAKTFEKAIKANPNECNYYVALMENHKSMGNTEEANKLAEIIREKFPEYAAQTNNQSIEGLYGYSNATTAVPQQFYNAPPMNYGQASGIASKPSMFPDYDSIGNKGFSSQDAAEISSAPSVLLPDLSDLVNPKNELPEQENISAPSAQAPITGPKKNCPHCKAVNPASEYYCNSCGKPF